MFIELNTIIGMCCIGIFCQVRTSETYVFMLFCVALICKKSKKKKKTRILNSNENSKLKVHNLKEKSKIQTHRTNEFSLCIKLCIKHCFLLSCVLDLTLKGFIFCVYQFGYLDEFFDILIYSRYHLRLKSYVRIY